MTPSRRPERCAPVSPWQVETQPSAGRAGSTCPECRNSSWSRRQPGKAVPLPDTHAGMTIKNRTAQKLRHYILQALITAGVGLMRKVTRHRMAGVLASGLDDGIDW